MKKILFRNLLCPLMVLSLILSGCSVGSSQSVNSTGFQGMTITAENCNYGGEISSVTAVNFYTVKFTLCKPDASFVKKMASPVLAIQDKDFLDKHHGNSKEMTAEMNGTGPFQVVENKAGSPIHLQPSSIYWGLPTSLTDIYFDFYTNELLANPIQLIYQHDVFNSVKATELLSALDSSANFKAYPHQMMDVVYIGFNNKIKPLDKTGTRVALSAGMNLSRLTNQFLSSGAETANQLIPSNVFPGWSSALDWYNYQSMGGVNLLKNSGFDFSQTLTLAYVDSPSFDIASPASLAQEIQQEFALMEVNVTLKPMSPEDFNKAMARGTEMMFLDSYQPLYSDAASYYEGLLVRNSQRFGDPYTTLLLDFEAAQSESSIQQRQLDFDKLNKDFRDNVPLIPIAYIPRVSYFDDSVNSVNTGPFFENYESLAIASQALKVMENKKPVSLWPADETDLDTFRITRLVYDTLVVDGFGMNDVQPSLADSWESNSDLTEWTFYLRYNVKFTDGSSLDANDVVASFGAIWDESNANHTGNSGNFTIFRMLFGNLLPKR